MGGDGAVAEIVGRVVDQVEAAPGTYRLTVEAPEVVAAARAGQFVMVRGWGGYDPLLPRPFSFAGLRYSEGVFEIIYRVVGRATALMAQWEPGQRIEVRGPLGNGFPLPSDITRPLALVGRGIGLAPLVCLAQTAARAGFQVWAFLSARTAENLRAFGGLRDVASRVWVTTDDGSEGTPGLVTDALATALELGDTQVPTTTVPAPPPAGCGGGGGTDLGAAYCCGSRRLARALGSIREKACAQGKPWFPVYVAVEQLMACGMGHCQGCVVKVAGGAGRVDAAARPAGAVSYARVCREGPVFPLERLVWE